MTKQVDLDAVSARSARVAALVKAQIGNSVATAEELGAALLSAADVPDLIDEIERLRVERRGASVTCLSPRPPIGAPAPDGTRWRGWIEFFDKSSDDRLRMYFAVTCSNDVFWLEGVTGDWLPELNDEAADAVRKVANESLS